MTRVTVEEVAAAAGVSRSTVSRVVNGSTRVSPHALKAVQTAIADLNYAPNRAARSLASRQTYAIGLVIPEDTALFFGDPFFAEVVAGISARLRGSDYILNLLVCSDDGGDKLTSFVRSGGVDGAIIVSHHDTDTFVDEIVGAVPAVFGGRPVTVRPSDYYVDIDNAMGARCAVEHLLAIGRTRLATITGRADMPASIDRTRGFHEELAAAGLTAVGEYQGDFTEAGGAAAASRLLAAADQKPDAIFVANDLMARGAVRVLQDAGLAVPQDVAIVGFDDSYIAAEVDPPLTTIRQPLHTQGQMMATVLLELLAGDSPEHATIVPSELVVRASA